MTTKKLPLLIPFVEIDLAHSVVLSQKDIVFDFVLVKIIQSTNTVSKTLRTLKVKLENQLNLAE